MVTFKSFVIKIILSYFTILIILISKLRIIQNTICFVSNITLCLYETAGFEIPFKAMLASIFSRKLSTVRFDSYGIKLNETLFLL